MSGRQRMATLSVLLFILPLAGCGTPEGVRTFEHAAFTFSIPPGWKTLEEIWKRPASSGEYYGLGVQSLVTIQYPPVQGQGRAFFAVASSPLSEGQDLQSRFTQAYRAIGPEIQDASTRPIQWDNFSGYEATYARAWGESWWRFRDIWLEKDGVIYVLSFHASPESFATYADTFEQISASFRFKD